MTLINIAIFNNQLIKNYEMWYRDGGNNMGYWLVGKKYDDLWVKKREYKGEEVEKQGNLGKIFTVHGGKNIILEKGAGEGQKCHILGKIYKKPKRSYV